MRTFNPDINSKTGMSLHPDAPRRGTPEWYEFECILSKAIRALGHETHWQSENPLFDDHDGEFDKRIYVHQTKREKPEGDLFWMQMHLRWLFTLDTNGWGADHSFPYEFIPNYIEDDEAREYCRKLSDEMFATGQSKCEQPSIESTSPTPPKFILVPLQIPRDYTIKHHSPITVKYFIDSVLAWAEESQNHVVFKMHPFNKRDADLIKSVEDGCANSRYVHKAEGNIHELIKRASGLFVINSGTGFEALIHSKPVCTFGNCDYNKVTFNADVRRFDEARNFIYSYSAGYRDLAYKYVWWYCNQHAYDVRDPNTPKRLEEYLRRVL